VKPGDRVIWLCSPGRSILTRWKVRRIPGVILRICRQRIKVKVRLDGRLRIINVDPDNVLCDEEADYSGK
jgi:hypothetical protein